MVRLPPSRYTLHCGLRIPDLRARDDSPLRRSCHHVGPASCRTRRLRAQRIRRCGLNATFRTRLQRCDGDWWPLSLRHSRVAHAAPLGTNTEICDTVRLEIRRKSATPPRPNRGSKRSDSAIATSSVCGLMPRKVAENMPGLSNTSLFLLLVGWTRWSKPSQRNVLRLNISHFPRLKSWLDSCERGAHAGLAQRCDG